MPRTNGVAAATSGSCEIIGNKSSGTSDDGFETSKSDLPATKSIVERKACPALSFANCTARKTATPIATLRILSAARSGCCIT